MLSINNVCKQYGGQTALQDVCMEIAPGESISLIGESGSGKSTLARMVLALEKPEKGQIYWQGRRMRSLRKKQLYKDIQPVFQNNTGCFNPRRKVGDSLCEPMKNLLGLSFVERQRKASQLLEMVGLPPSITECYPHELSGGQQKRVCIARALSIRPRLVVLDEAVSGLDATVLIKILALLKDLQKEVGCAYLFITHDIRAALYMSGTIAVMKDGQIVETAKNGSSPASFTHPFAIELLYKNTDYQGGQHEKNHP